MSQKSDLRKSIREEFEKFIGFLGFELHLRRLDKRKNRTLFDKNMLQRYVEDNEALDLYQEGQLKSNMLWADNFAKQCRFYSLFRLAKSVLDKGIEGDFAENGCWMGHSTYALATILQSSNFSNKFYIFDSFEGGLSDKTENDSNLRTDLNATEINKEKEIFSSSLESVKELLSPFPFVEIHKGWIPEKFDRVEDRQFAYVHIDVDLYEPTRDCLNFFYPRLNKNGVIIIDDYGLSQFGGCKKAVDEFLKTHQFSHFIEEHLGGCIIIK